MSDKYASDKGMQKLFESFRKTVNEEMYDSSGAASKEDMDSTAFSAFGAEDGFDQAEMAALKKEIIEEQFASFKNRTYDANNPGENAFAEFLERNEKQLLYVIEEIVENAEDAYLSHMMGARGKL